MVSKITQSGHSFVGAAANSLSGAVAGLGQDGGESENEFDGGAGASSLEAGGAPSASDQMLRSKTTAGFKPTFPEAKLRQLTDELFGSAGAG